MVEAARGAGASAKFAGSGGAIVGVLPDRSAYPKVRDALERVGARVLEPRVS
jgi:glucuronokinase